MPPQSSLQNSTRVTGPRVAIVMIATADKADADRVVKDPAQPAPVDLEGKEARAAATVTADPDPKDDVTARAEALVAKAADVGARIAGDRKIPGIVLPSAHLSPFSKGGSSPSFPRRSPSRALPSRFVPAPRPIRSSSSRA